VYRGVVASCTACGGLRLPLTGPSVNLAGAPSKVGGAVASVAGWLVLLFGGSLSLGIGLLLGAIFSLGVAMAFALPIAFIALGVGLALLKGGSTLRRSGSDAALATREQALLAMAATAGRDPCGASGGSRRGITAPAAARALGVSVEEADTMLTALAKREPDPLAVEIDDQGAVWYSAAPEFARAPRIRVGADEYREERNEPDLDDQEQAGRVRR
jgi:hypothetical protein